MALDELDDLTNSAVHSGRSLMATHGAAREVSVYLEGK